MEDAHVRAAELERPTVVVIGNEKGGTGKSTTAIHLAVALMHQGFRVAALDLDLRQRTLTRYIENRRRYATASHTDLPIPALMGNNARRGFSDDEGFDYLIVDTPGSASPQSRAGHEVADILITPMNDSQIDVDVLARVDWERRIVLEPSVYSRFVWECRNRRAVEGNEALRWIVIRNRLPHIYSRNKHNINGLMELLSQHIGFQLAQGFGDRVVFREMFPTGLTVFDLPEMPARDGRASSLLAARAEVGSLLNAIGAPRSEAAYDRRFAAAGGLSAI